MPEPHNAQSVFVVVEVMSGVAVDAFSFADLGEARKCLGRLRKDRDSDEDDVQLFETELGAFSSFSRQK
jgi:hypothetical protein